jgi:hypothetical protein
MSHPSLLNRLLGAKIKPLSRADLGVGQSHQTHIGLLQGSFTGWETQIKCRGHVFHKNKERTGTVLIDPIFSADGSLRSPKLRKGNAVELGGDESVLTIIRALADPGDGLAIAHLGDRMAFLIIPSSEFDLSASHEVLPAHLFEAKGALLESEVVSDTDQSRYIMDEGMLDLGLMAVEGEPRAVAARRLRRCKELRDAYVDKHGWSCKACGMLLSDKYGPAADGLIEVHHLKPLGDLQGRVTKNSLRDLVGLCPNCHRVAHRRTPPYSVDEIRSFIDQAGQENL